MAVTLSSTFHAVSPPHLAAPRRRRMIPPARSAASYASAEGEPVEIRVCVNRSCGRQGSREALEILSALAPPRVAVSSCGCLGRCGAGPNLVVLPAGSAVGHCGTPARAARVLSELCGVEFDPRVNLEALALRKKGEAELESGNACRAETLLSQAIDLKPSGGLHFIYSARSAARLEMGDYTGALEDAEQACGIASKYPQAYICRGDALLAMGELSAAEYAYSSALLIDPSIRRSKSFKARVARLQEKLVTSGSSSP